MGYCVPPAPRFGRDHARFAGGLRFAKDRNRWYIICRDGKRYPYYRGVMEAHLGRELRPEESVHHVNGDSADDRIENLELLSKSEHAHTHHARLSNEDVRAIRASTELTAVVGERYGVTPQYVSQLRTGTAKRVFGMERAT